MLGQELETGTEVAEWKQEAGAGTGNGELKWPTGNRKLKRELGRALGSKEQGAGKYRRVPEGNGRERKASERCKRERSNGESEPGLGNRTDSEETRVSDREEAS